jgi:hypothetical protein
MSTPAPAAKTAAKPAAKGAAAAPSRPFITGTREIESHVYDNTVTMQTTSVTLPDYDLVTDGYVAGIYIYVQGVVTANTTAATGTFQEDAPWNALGTVQFADVSNRPILGPMSGYELKTLIKFGGFSFSDDAQDSALYAVTASSTSAGGSFQWVLHLPIEFVHRNALGSLTNLSNASVFRLSMTLNASTGVYAGTTGTPVVLPQVRVRIQQHGWMESAGHDPFGNPAASAPPAVDSVMYSERQTYTVNAGSQNFRLTPFEGQVRGLLFFLRDSTGSRLQGEADWPDPLRLHYDATVPLDRIKDIWKRMVEEQFGYTAAQPASLAGGSAAINPAASFRDNGVYPIAYNRDFGKGPGAEQCYGYMYVSAGTALRFDGTIQGSGVHTLTVIPNYINPAGGNALALTGGK